MRCYVIQWMEGRYQAIQDHFATQVLEVFDVIHTLHDDGVLIGAITDGNSDPRNIPELEPYFDFCINAESVGVAKPDPRVYQKAIEYVLQHPSVQDIVEASVAEQQDMKEMVVGPW